MPNQKTRLTNMQANITGKLIALSLVAISMASVSTFVSAADGAYDQLESQLITVEKHGKASEQADALYDLAKAHFENRDPAKADPLMRQALDLEKTLKRPTALVRTESALASICVAENKSAEAKQLYEEVLAFANEHKMIDEAISTSISLGSLAMHDGQLDVAEKLYRQASADAQAHGLAAAQANALINLAVFERANNHLSDALNCLNQALPLVEKQGTDTTMGNIFMEMGRTQADLNQFDQAIESFHKAKDHFAQDFDTQLQGKALIAAGQIRLTREQLPEAESELNEAIKILSSEADDAQTKDSALGSSEKQQASVTLVDCLTSLAGVYTAEQNLDQSEQALNRALAMAEGLNSTERMRQVLTEQGYLLLVRGQLEQALTSYQKAYALLPNDGGKASKIRAVLLTDLAMCYKSLGLLDQAITNYNQALSLLEALGDVPGQALAANNLAVAYLDGGKLKDFDRVWHQASSLFAQAKDTKGQALMSYNYGQSKLFRGQAADAIGDYQNALALMRTAHDTTGINKSLRGLGLAYLLSKQPEKAIDCYKESLTMSEQAANSEGIWDSQLGLGKAYKALGNKDQALDYLQQAVSSAEGERGQLSRDTFKTFNLDLRQDCFYELVDLLLQENKAEEALAVAERGRARAFADLLASRQGSINHPLNSGADVSQPQLTVNTVALPQDLLKPSQEFATTSTTTAEALSASELKQLVKDHNAICLEYYLLPNKLVIWAIDQTGAVHLLPAQAISAQQLANNVTELYNTIIAQPKTLEEIKQSGLVRQAKLKAMYKLLIAPVEPLLLADQPVIIVPHGPLFLVPFAALMNNQGKFLVEGRTISVSPAISVLKATSRLAAGSAKDDKLLAFGNPTSDAFAGLGSLPYAEKEVQTTAELFGNANATTKLGTQANRKTFVELAPSTPIIHMACHGIINEEHPTLSGLVLAKDGQDNGFLSVKDILALPPLQARLIVLSACQTGRGKITGDGVIGLSRAFIAAGTPSVIVSHWNVDDVIAEFQMEEFYKSLLSGKGKAESLRQAQLSTISSMEGSMADTSSPTFIRANPRYWAAFQLIGEAQ